MEGAAGAFGATAASTTGAAFGVSSDFVQPSCSIQLAIICLASGDQPSSGPFVAIACLVASP